MLYQQLQFVKGFNLGFRILKLSQAKPTKNRLIGGFLLVGTPARNLAVFLSLIFTKCQAVVRRLVSFLSTVMSELLTSLFGMVI